MPSMRIHFNNKATLNYDITIIIQSFQAKQVLQRNSESLLMFLRISVFFGFQVCEVFILDKLRLRCFQRKILICAA